MMEIVLNWSKDSASWILYRQRKYRYYKASISINKINIIRIKTKAKIEDINQRLNYQMFQEYELKINSIRDEVKSLEDVMKYVNNDRFMNGLLKQKRLYEAL